MEEKNTRGDIVMGYFKFIEKKWGQAGLNDVTKAAGIDLASLTPGGWYDEKYSNAVMNWIHDNKGPNMIERCAYETIKNLGFLRYIVRFMNMESILKRGKKTYYDAFTFGEYNYMMHKDGASVILNGSRTTEHSCISWIGAFRAMLDVTNTKGTVEEITCQGNGDEVCEFRFKW